MKGYAAKLQAFGSWQLAFGSWLLAKINENEDVYRLTFTVYRLPFTEDENCHPEGTVVCCPLTVVK